jgi:hypothetical protein
MAKNGLTTKEYTVPVASATGSVDTDPLDGDWLRGVAVISTTLAAGADLTVKDKVTGATLLTKDSPAAGDYYQLDYSSVGPTASALSGIAKSWRTNGDLVLSIAAGGTAKEIVLIIDHQDTPVR